jgi:hypothetical protein
MNDNDLISLLARLNLQTNLGKLDVLCGLAEGEGYDELLPHAFEHKVAGKNVLVLGLEKVTET